MVSRSSIAAILLALGLGATAALVSLAILATIPVQRSPVHIADPDEPDVPDDFDALLLRGQLEDDAYVVTLVVAGVVQDSRYIVGVLVKDLGEAWGPYVYQLEYHSGAEENYGTPTTRSGDSLTFRFSLSHLSRDAYIVGLDANVFGPLGQDSHDNVKEGPREALQIQRILAPTVNPGLLGIAAAITATATAIGTVKFVGRVGSTTRRGS